MMIIITTEEAIFAADAIPKILSLRFINRATAKSNDGLHNKILIIKPKKVSISKKTAAENNDKKGLNIKSIINKIAANRKSSLCRFSMLNPPYNSNNYFFCFILFLCYNYAIKKFF